MTDVTRLSDAAAAGDRKAATELLPLVYDELRKLAAAKMAAENPEHLGTNKTAPKHLFPHWVSIIRQVWRNRSQKCFGLAVLLRVESPVISIARKRPIDSPGSAHTIKT
jgi:hypothetical protein